MRWSPKTLIRCGPSVSPALCEKAAGRWLALADLWRRAQPRGRRTPPRPRRASITIPSVPWRGLRLRVRRSRAAKVHSAHHAPVRRKLTVARRNREQLPRCCSFPDLRASFLISGRCAAPSPCPASEGLARGAHAEPARSPSGAALDPDAMAGPGLTRMLRIQQALSTQADSWIVRTVNHVY